MACLQNGTTLLNNNNLSSFKHNIMKYDETHANVYTSQINNFLSNQIPFRNNHTKDKTQSDNNVFNEDENVNDQMKHSCANNRNAPSDGDDEEEECRTIHNNKNNDNNNDNDNNNEIINEKSETNTTNANVYNYNDDSYQKEFPSDKGATVVEPTESGEPSHHARRPMNAFLIFCKRHRTIVKNRYPHLENRAVTKILGEWWAGLEPEDKACYTELAKQYKNAFFSANPNFKWYKLPAPPLRTLNTRPGNIVKSPPPTKDAHENDEQLTSQQLPQPQQPQQLFTPGKLADETQLGSITSLINSNNQHGGGGTKTILNNNYHNKNENKNNENEEQPVLNYKNYLLSPENSNLIGMSQPPKPFKKRLVLTQNTTITDAKNIVVRNIFTENTGTNNKTEGNIFDSSLLQEALQSFVYDEAFEGDFHLDSNLTQQELINKVVDHMCSSASSSKTDSNDGNPDGDADGDDDMDDEYNQDDLSRETRKSVRSCKGLLYAKFMAEGKLFVSKRNRKALAGTKSSFVSSNVSDKVPRNTEPIELSDTIKKLAERTIGSGTSSSAKTTTASTTSTTPSISTTNNYMKLMDHEQQQQQQQQNEQEQHEETMKKMFRAADFNLDEKIEALPSLSLDKFQQKKKENKKRKFLRATKMKDTERKKTTTNIITNINTSTSTSENETTRSEMNLIGSRKRKPIGKPRKQNNNNNDKNNINNNNKDACEIDLFGLATLAEVAAKKAKIDQK